MAKKGNQANLVGVLSYITIIGWVIALLIHLNEKTSLGGFHLRQALLIYIAMMVVSWIPMIGWVLNIILMVFLLMGIVYAVQGKEEQLPVIGPLAQDWFKSI